MSIDADHVPITDNSSDTRQQHNCADVVLLLDQLNHFFRDEQIFDHSEYSSTIMGYVIICQYALIIIVGASGNLLTMLAIIRNPTMRTTPNYFIFNLALSDFFISTVTAPITLYTVLYVFWPFGTIMCKIAGSMQGFSIFLSTFSITAIALNRYIMVIFPTKRRRQQRLTLCCFVSIWVLSALLAVPLLIASDRTQLPDLDKLGCDNLHYYQCYEQNANWKTMPIGREMYTIIVLTIQYCMPLASLVFVYSSIANRVHMRFVSTRRHQNNNARRRSVQTERQRRTNVLLVCIICVFAISWLPLNIFHLVNTFHWFASFHVPTFAMCHVIGMLSSSANPILYVSTNENFRIQFVDMFERIGIMTIVRTARRVVIKCCPRIKDGGGNKDLVVTAGGVDLSRIDNTVLLKPTDHFDDQSRRRLSTTADIVVVVNTV